MAPKLVLGRRAFGIVAESLSRREMRPNYALQRAAPHVAAPASSLRLSPATQVPRRAPRSLSLGSLGVAARLCGGECERTEPRLHAVAFSVEPSPGFPAFQRPSFEPVMRAPAFHRAACNVPSANQQRLTRALQRTGRAVTAPASLCFRLSPAAQGPRQPGQSLSFLLVRRH